MVAVLHHDGKHTCVYAGRHKTNTYTHTDTQYAHLHTKMWPCSDKYIHIKHHTLNAQRLFTIQSPQQHNFFNIYIYKSIKSKTIQFKRNIDLYIVCVVTKE